MNQQKTSKFLLIILLFMLSFGFCTQSLAQKYSDLQTKTAQTNVKRRAIYPSKYEGETSTAKTTKKPEKKEGFGDLLMKMVRALILIVALFLGLAAYVAKHKDKFKNIKLPNALKNAAITQEEPTETVEDTPTPAVAQTQSVESSLDTRDTKIRELVFKFFEINK